MRALVTGATGFIGRRLARELSRPVVLSRDPDGARRLLGDVEAHAWDAASGPPPVAALRADAGPPVDVVFHLAGDSIAGGRWNAARKERIRDSRIAGTRHLVAALAAAEPRPRVLVSASAIGIYGSRGDEILDEQSAPGEDFLADLCRDWEKEAGLARDLGIRVVTPRIGIVLGRGGGALAKMLPPFKLGIGGRLGHGNQWMSWVHLDDLVALLLHAATDERISGPMNAVAPAPVTNREFTRTLAAVLHRPAIFPVPRAALRLAVGEFADFLLSSQRVLPRVAEHTGYAFRHRELADALRDVV